MSGARRTSRRPESTGGPARRRRARRQPGGHDEQGWATAAATAMGAGRSKKLGGGGGERHVDGAAGTRKPGVGSGDQGRRTREMQRRRDRMVCLPDRWDPLICRPRIEGGAGVGLNFLPSYCAGRLANGKVGALFLESGWRCSK